ncbi:hypothetical protein F7204_08090, partial [Helicobacter pylori]|nr:hypothetical protein [Helicobacter pylori]MUU38718.1 hypothetical protein [Helicobacter pylori]
KAFIPNTKDIWDFCLGGFKDIFKKIVLNDFRGLEFLKKYEVIRDEYYAYCLNALKIKGLKNSLKHAIENKDYILIEALNHKIKELHYNTVSERKKGF